VTLVLQTAFLRPRARLRIGAHCIPNDTRALAQLARKLATDDGSIAIASRTCVRTSCRSKHTHTLRRIHMSATNALPHKPQFFATRMYLLNSSPHQQTATTECHFERTLSKHPFNRSRLIKCGYYILPSYHKRFFQHF
jgi:hypothetical protein